MGNQIQSSAGGFLWGRVALAITLALFVCTLSSQAQTNLRPLSGHVPLEVAKGQAARIGSAAPTQHLHLAFELPLRNQSDLASFLKRLYDPNSPDFHRYLSVDEFTEKYGPSKEDYQAVMDFVKGHGMTVLGTTPNRMLVNADGTVAQVNGTLHVTMTEYKDPTKQPTFLSPDREPSIESNVPIRFISGLSTLLPPKARLTFNTKSSQSSSTYANDSSSTYPPNPTGSGPYGSYIPSDLRAAYYGDGPLDGSGQTIGLVEFDGYDQVDLDNFYSTIGAQQNVPINVVLLGGLTAPLDDGGNDAEPILDITYALSMTPKLSQVRVYECCSPTYSGSDSGPVVILNSIASENIAKQISSSYGWGPELSAEDPIYQEMAAQGQTFFAATGDYGSPLNPGNDTFDDYYPADDAYVTAVSMSLVTTNGPGGSWASDIYAGGAGGGYSDGPTPVPLPSYQMGIATVANQASTLYRNMPDVVIDGFGSFLCGGSDSTNTHQCFPNSGCTTCTNGGSSMSAPIWASYMALVNEEAANEGKPPIGFLNPSLYSIGESSSYASDFHDIVGGSNNCCGQSYAYSAVPGYDLVSGWGTPNGPNLMADLLGQSSALSLLASDNLLSMGPNDNSSTVVSVVSSGGFSGMVTLSVSGLPPGVTASFDTNPTFQGSNLTFASDGSPKAGTYTVLITGTSGSLTESTTVTLTVTSTQGNFIVGSTLTATAIQDGTSIAANSNNTNVVTVTSLDNFSGTVNLALKNVPAGVTASFNPASLALAPGASATSVITLSASTTAPTGSATVLIVGSSGTLTNDVPLLLALTPASTVVNVPGFSLSATPTFVTMTRSTTTVAVTVSSQNGFAAPVTLNVSGLPNGILATLTPDTVSLNAGSSAAVAVNLTGTAVAKRENPLSGIPITALAFLLLPLTGCFKRSRGKIMSLSVLCIVSLAILAGPTGCSSSMPATAPTSPATVTITGSSGPLTSTTTFTLDVQ